MRISMFIAVVFLAVILVLGACAPAFLQEKQDIEQSLKLDFSIPLLHYGGQSSQSRHIVPVEGLKARVEVRGQQSDFTAQIRTVDIVLSEGRGQGSASFDRLPAGYTYTVSVTVFRGSGDQIENLHFGQAAVLIEPRKQSSSSLSLLPHADRIRLTVPLSSSSIGDDSGQPNSFQLTAKGYSALRAEVEGGTTFYLRYPLDKYPESIFWNVQREDGSIVTPTTNSGYQQWALPGGTSGAGYYLSVFNAGSTTYTIDFDDWLVNDVEHIMSIDSKPPLPQTPALRTVLLSELAGFSSSGFSTDKHDIELLLVALMAGEAVGDPLDLLMEEAFSELIDLLAGYEEYFGEELEPFTTSESLDTDLGSSNTQLEIVGRLVADAAIAFNTTRMQAAIAGTLDFELKVLQDLITIDDVILKAGSRLHIVAALALWIDMTEDGDLEFDLDFDFQSSAGFTLDGIEDYSGKFILGLTASGSDMGSYTGSEFDNGDDEFFEGLLDSLFESFLISAAAYDNGNNQIRSFNLSLSELLDYLISFDKNMEGDFSLSRSAAYHQYGEAYDPYGVNWLEFYSDDSREEYLGDGWVDYDLNQWRAYIQPGEYGSLYVVAKYSDYYVFEVLGNTIDGPFTIDYTGNTGFLIDVSDAWQVLEDYGQYESVDVSGSYELDPYFDGFELTKLYFMEYPDGGDSVGYGYPFEENQYYGWVNKGNYYEFYILAELWNSSDGYYEYFLSPAMYEMDFTSDVTGLDFTIDETWSYYYVEEEPSEVYLYGSYSINHSGLDGYELMYFYLHEDPYGNYPIGYVNSDGYNNVYGYYYPDFGLPVEFYNVYAVAELYNDTTSEFMSLISPDLGPLYIESYEVEIFGLDITEEWQEFMGY
ncbi:hypothetical protein [Spirochaeta dissipatitropha]